MSAADFETALVAAEAELNVLSEQAREAFQRFKQLDQRQTEKADYIRELRRQVREAASSASAEDGKR